MRCFLKNKFLFCSQGKVKRTVYTELVDLNSSNEEIIELNLDLRMPITSGLFTAIKPSFHMIVM